MSNKFEEEHVSKAELSKFINQTVIESGKREDNVVTRLGMLAAFQMIKEKFKL